MDDFENDYQHGRRNIGEIINKGLNEDDYDNLYSSQTDTSRRPAHQHLAQLKEQLAEQKSLNRKEPICNR